MNSTNISGEITEITLISTLEGDDMNTVLPSIYIKTKMQVSIISYLKTPRYRYIPHTGIGYILHIGGDS